MALKKPDGELIKEFRYRVRGMSKNKQVDLYYLLSNDIKRLRSERDYKQMLECCEKSLPLIESVIEWDEQFSGEEWDGSNGLVILAIENACDYLPVMELLEDLEMYEQFVNEMPKLNYYKQRIQNAFLMYDIVQKIKLLFKDNDEIRKKNIKRLINENDGRTISRVIKYLENVGKITRIKEGSDHIIFWPEINRKKKLQNNPPKKENFFKRLLGF